MSVPNHLFTSYHSKNTTMGANADKQRFDLCCLTIATYTDKGCTNIYSSERMPIMYGCMKNVYICMF